MKIKIGFILIGIGLIGSGCRIIQPVEMPSGHYYLNASTNFHQIGKVVLLELDNHSTHQEQSLAFSQALADGLGKKHLFSIRLIGREDPAWQMLELDSINRYTNEQLADIRETLGTDALVFGAINRYSSYPFFLIGVHLKMVDLQEGRIVWALEEVWDSTDKSTEQRMRQFFEDQMRTGYQPMNWQVLETSPRYFNKFVAYEITQTLPKFEVTGNPGSSSENVLNFSSISRKTINFLKKY